VANLQLLQAAASETMPGICIWHSWHAKASCMEPLLTAVTDDQGLWAAVLTTSNAYCVWVNGVALRLCIGFVLHGCLPLGLLFALIRLFQLVGSRFHLQAVASTAVRGCWCFCLKCV
jgi:hypothetical protein